MQGNGSFTLENGILVPIKLSLTQVSIREIAIEADIGDGNPVRLGIFKEGCLWMNRLPTSVQLRMGIFLNSHHCLSIHYPSL